MPPVCRKGDLLTTGHTCVGMTKLDWPTQATVWAEGKPMARMGDKTIEHPFPPKPPCKPHFAFVNEGLTSLLVVGKFQARVRDSADTEPAGKMIQGAMSVWAGGGSAPQRFGPGF